MRRSLLSFLVATAMVCAVFDVVSGSLGLAGNVAVGNISPAAERRHASDDPMAGVGIALRLDATDEYPVVSELISDGSAGEDGHIKAGDAIVGIENEDGTILEFKGKLLREIVSLIRGPVDSKVKLVVRHKGEEVRKTYELKRKPLPQ